VVGDALGFKGADRSHAPDGEIPGQRKKKGILNVKILNKKASEKENDRGEPPPHALLGGGGEHKINMQKNSAEIPRGGRGGKNKSRGPRVTLESLRGSA